MAYARAHRTKTIIGYARQMLTTPCERWPIAGCGKYAVTVQTILRFPDHHLRTTAQRVVFNEELCDYVE